MNSKILRSGRTIQFADISWRNLKRSWEDSSVLLGLVTEGEILSREDMEDLAEGVYSSVFWKQKKSESSSSPKYHLIECSIMHYLHQRWQDIQELDAKLVIQFLTDLPVVLGHEKYEEDIDGVDRKAIKEVLWKTKWEVK